MRQKKKKISLDFGFLTKLLPAFFASGKSGGPVIFIYHYSPLPFAFATVNQLLRRGFVGRDRAHLTSVRHRYRTDATRRFAPSVFFLVRAPCPEPLDNGGGRPAATF